ncbi:fumarylacetoacetate hydrolase family protein [Humisphaera borealis]|uniref:Fumarylacetoacetate hydrolase family protein n=1 Tax=Humisphaera borealis TaxID=2807512 RepID=A0A7M2WYT2_9BACT|nr:fumarylacetoacetate hydrolase family protein [Humisphaera borealis]QOV89640.1 fumarylacetoacetate hydrolase family protein [Humisphaera borealis]
MKLYRTTLGPMVETKGSWHVVPELAWDAIFALPDPRKILMEGVEARGEINRRPAPSETDILAPIGSQEVWAAGVTYLRSRDARKEEAKSGGGGDFYDKVYDAARPEIFFKSTAHRTVGPGQAVRIRKDSKWNVPEPELTLVVNPAGKIIGYTVGNDMSSRDIEGENPLYLPQAKVYDASCALGPCIYLPEDGAPLPPLTEIKLTISRGGVQQFLGITAIAKMKRRFDELVEYLYRDNSFPQGVFLMTGTGVVPPDDFTLHSGDEIRIEIGPIGVLRNVVA